MGINQLNSMEGDCTTGPCGDVDCCDLPGIPFVDDVSSPTSTYYPTTATIDLTAFAWAMATVSGFPLDPTILQTCNCCDNLAAIYVLQLISSSPTTALWEYVSTTDPLLTAYAVGTSSASRTVTELDPACNAPVLSAGSCGDNPSVQGVVRLQYTGVGGAASLACTVITPSNYPTGGFTSTTIFSATPTPTKAWASSCFPAGGGGDPTRPQVWTPANITLPQTSTGTTHKHHEYAATRGLTSEDLYCAPPASIDVAFSDFRTLRLVGSGISTS